MIPRWFHKLYAHIAGYFWIPCPICGQMFGGHEIDADATALYDQSGEGKGIVCPGATCNMTAFTRNAMTFGSGSILYWHDGKGIRAKVLPGIKEESK